MQGLAWAPNASVQSGTEGTAPGHDRELRTRTGAPISLYPGSTEPLPERGCAAGCSCPLPVTHLRHASRAARRRLPAAGGALRAPRDAATRASGVACACGVASAAGGTRCGPRPSAGWCIRCADGPLPGPPGSSGCRSGASAARNDRRGGARRTSRRIRRPTRNSGAQRSADRPSRRSRADPVWFAGPRLGHGAPRCWSKNAAMMPLSRAWTSERSSPSRSLHSGTPFASRSASHSSR